MTPSTHIHIVCYRIQVVKFFVMSFRTKYNGGLGVCALKVSKLLYLLLGKLWCLRVLLSTLLCPLLGQPLCLLRGILWCFLFGKLWCLLLSKLMCLQQFL